jgi:hypothetical protein
VALALVALALLAVGCSLALAYRHADWLILWEVDHYFDLTLEQKTSLDRNLKVLLARHRTEALPAYEAFLSQIRERVRSGLAREDVDWAFTAYQRLRADLFERIVGDGAVFLASVDERQVQYLEQALRKGNQKSDRLLKVETEERLAKRARATVDFVEDWLGALTADQKRQITTMSRALPDLQGPWVNYQRHQQQELLHQLRTRQSPEVLSAYLRDWLIFPERQAPPAYQRALEDLRVGTRDMILAVDRMASPQQRSHAIEKLHDLIDTIHELAVS